MHALRKMRKTGRKGNDGGSRPVENLRGRGMASSGGFVEVEWRGDGKLQDAGQWRRASRGGLGVCRGRRWWGGAGKRMIGKVEKVGEEECVEVRGGGGEVEQFFGGGGGGGQWRRQRVDCALEIRDQGKGRRRSRRRAQRRHIKVRRRWRRLVSFLDLP